MWTLVWSLLRTTRSLFKTQRELANPYAERLIGSLRRECLDHVIVLDEVHLHRIPGRYFKYYNTTRCHLSLAGDARNLARSKGSNSARVAEFPDVGGLHHRYERAAA